MQRKRPGRASSEDQKVARPPAAKPSRASLLTRVSTLEARVAELERQLGRLRPAPPSRPEPKKDDDPRPRCPGCQLRVDSIARGRCSWCGFHFDVVRQLRRLART